MRTFQRTLAPLLLALFVASSGFAAHDTDVYATQKGKKYHVKNCRMKSGSKKMKLSVAKKMGYTACLVCKPKHDH